MQQYMFCERCGSAISLKDIGQIGIWVKSDGEVRLVIRYRCSRCKHVGEESVDANVRIPTTVETMTEIGPQERRRFEKMKPITADEVIEFYQYLRKLRCLPRKRLASEKSETRNESKQTSRSTYHLT